MWCSRHFEALCYLELRAARVVLEGCSVWSDCLIHKIGKTSVCLICNRTHKVPASEWHVVGIKCYVPWIDFLRAGHLSTGGQLTREKKASCETGVRFFWGRRRHFLLSRVPLKRPAWSLPGPSRPSGNPSASLYKVKKLPSGCASVQLSPTSLSSPLVCVLASVILHPWVSRKQDLWNLPGEM